MEFVINAKMVFISMDHDVLHVQLIVKNVHLTENVLNVKKDYSFQLIKQFVQIVLVKMLLIVVNVQKDIISMSVEKVVQNVKIIVFLVQMLQIASNVNMDFI